MKIAKNKKGQFVDIKNSSPDEEYYCPVCHELLIRSFGLEKQYFSHQKDKDNTSCEIKMKLLLKKDNTDFTQEDQFILQEYYNKFSDVKIQLSDYKSEEGYYLTQEQKDIIFSKEDRIKISALAGAAKTSTLYYYAKERPFKKILYIVYNKAMKDEAERTFGNLHNVEIKTIHGLAYKYVGKYYRQKLTFNYNAIDIIKNLNLDWNEDQEIAIKINDMMIAYMLSEVQNFEDLDMYNDDYNKKYRPVIIKLCEKLWNLKKDYNSKVKIEHDFYLKLFQLAKVDLSKQYDIILLDESQDASKLVLSILNNSNVKGIVIVGDKYQKLYGWRNAIDIAPFFKGKEYKLTTSFRVNQNIADIANIMVSDVTNTNIKMLGFNKNQKIVDKIDRHEPYACLCRTNSYIFAEVLDAMKEGNKRIYFEGGYRGYKFENIKDSYYFSLGHKVKNPMLNKFKNYEQMEEYAENTDDLELKAIIRTIDKYGDIIPDLIDKIKNNIVKDKSKADIIFSTIHKSKGMTYSIPVLISDDHFDIETFFRNKFINKKANMNDENYKDEMSIVYVGITRCAGEIELSDTLKRYLILRYKYKRGIE